MAFASGKWYLTSSENFGAYLQAIGVSEDNRMRACSLMEQTGEHGFVEEFLIANDAIKRIIYIGGEQQGDPTPFVPFNKQLDANALDGRKIKVLLKMEEEKLIREESGDGYSSLITNTFQGDDRVMVLKTGDVVCTRKFRRCL
ncbi:hypothetical protein HELRODRAFT_188505 [Helobdella robusta]|uniref:Cytosolic fatty-acid binding proteins domain-containing protein n=1 Tax=Helobdella robusta TaxID=6412 RepID=T1FQ24_HELRO|nr:hypothetical protein HELRODRAFT_188505 [Helobdella robusta]ESO01865.1 hypothetical protein HELRODRAFT_188505 [Helobdella robusta]